MQHEVDVNGRIRQVAVHRADGGFVVAVDGRAWQVLAAQVDLHTLSLLIGERVGLKPDAGTDTTAGSAFGRTVLSYEATLVPAPGSAQLVVDVAGPAVSLERRTTRVLVTLNGRRSRGSVNERAQPGYDQAHARP